MLRTEPNSAQDRLSNIVLDGVTILNNAGNGIDLPTDELANANDLGNVHFPAAMVTIVVRNLLIDGGMRGGVW